MKDYLVNAKDQIQDINTRMENGEGVNDKGLLSISKEVGVEFEQLKAYILSF